MKRFPVAAALFSTLVALGLYADGVRSAEPGDTNLAQQASPRSANAIATPTLERSGRTTYSPGRRAEIAPTVMHPVTRVLVQPGDAVKAGQPLVEIDSDEPAAKHRARVAEYDSKRANLASLRAFPRAQERAEAEARLHSADITGKAAQAYLDRLVELRRQDAVSERQFIEQQTALHQAEADRRAAAARLDYLLNQPLEHELAEAEAEVAAAKAEAEAAEHELSHYAVRAAIDGVVARLDAVPGSVHEAGTSTWGEIVDLREVDVRVDLTPAELRRIDRRQPVEIGIPELDDRFPAKIAYVSPIADPESGRIPVVLRVPNADGRLAINVAVSAKFSTVATIDPARSQPTK